jgi:hypothetical protein
VRLPAANVRRSPSLVVLIALVNCLVPLKARGPGDSILQPNGISRASWTTRATTHFDIYYQRQQESVLDEVAREAERAYVRVSLDLQRDLAARVPIILVETARDLPQNRQEASEIVRASGAPDRDHLLVSLEPVNGRAAVLVHELTHLFEFEIFLASNLVPSCVTEGLSDHEAGTWASSDLSKLRDAAAVGAIPSATNLSGSARLWGHAFFDFIAAEYGTQGIRRYLSALRDGSVAGDELVRVAFGVEASDFDSTFRVYVRARFSDH